MLAYIIAHKCGHMYKVLKLSNQELVAQASKVLKSVRLNIGPKFFPPGAFLLCGCCYADVSHHHVTVLLLIIVIECI